MPSWYGNNNAVEQEVDLNEIAQGIRVLTREVISMTAQIAEVAEQAREDRRALLRVVEALRDTVSALDA